MQNLFISPEDELVINFSVATNEKGTVFCDADTELLKSLLESIGVKIENFTINEYKAVFKKPSFGSMIQMQSSINLEEGGVSFNPIVARYSTITTLIKSWNLKGKEEKPTEEDIKQLHPIIANVIGSQLDKETGMFS